MFVCACEVKMTARAKAKARVDKMKEQLGKTKAELTQMKTEFLLLLLADVDCCCCLLDACCFCCC